jgi:hypothetical protein
MKTNTLQKISKYCALGYLFCFVLFLYVYDIKNSSNSTVIEEHNKPLTPINESILPLHIAKIGMDAEEF